MVFKAEEDPAIPLGASDLVGYRRQRLVRLSEIFEVVDPDSHAVRDALPLPDQLGAGDRPVDRADFPLRGGFGVILLGHGAEPVAGLPAEPAVGKLLNPVGEPALQEAAVILGRLAVKKPPPLCLQNYGRCALQACQLA